MATETDSPQSNPDEPAIGGSGGTASPATLREIATDSLRYWEPRRVIYNAVLVVIVLGVFLASWPESGAAFSLDRVLIFVALAVLANVAYCAAYVADVFVQLSGLRPVWLRYRWILWTVGMMLAGIVTRFWAAGLFSPESVK